jgi:hypothetical protein
MPDRDCRVSQVRFQAGASRSCHFLDVYTPNCQHTTRRGSGDVGREGASSNPAVGKCTAHLFPLRSNVAPTRPTSPLPRWGGHVASE